MSSHDQSTASTTARASRQRPASPGRSARGPSATTSSFGGRASRTRSKTRAVVSGRLKISIATGVRNSQPAIGQW